MVVLLALLPTGVGCRTGGDEQTPIITPERPKDAGRDTRGSSTPSGGTGGSSGMNMPTPPADASAQASPDSAPVTDAIVADIASEASTGGDTSVPDIGGGSEAGGGTGTPPTMEARWAHTGCNKAALMFPNIDKNMGKFPIGSCPPPADLPRPCGGNSKIKVMASEALTWERGYWHPPEYAHDEHIMTRWSSNSMMMSWLQLDLGTEQSFKRIYLAWELAHASGYDIVTSNDRMTWTMVKQVRGGDGYQDIVDLEGRGRYIRINGVIRGEIGEGPYGYSLFDVTICGERP